MKKIKLFITLLSISSFTLKCNNCGHLCNSNCIIDQNGNCISHMCESKENPLDIKGPLG